MQDYIPFLLPDIPGIHRLDVYEANGGYTHARKALLMTPDRIITEVKNSGLRGRGGAAFPTGLKWTFMPKQTDKTKYLVINGDESEPGSFKDRQIFEFNPHLLIEGIIISSFAIGASVAYLYIRGEYEHWVQLMEKAIDDAYAKGYLGGEMPKTFGTDFTLELHVHRGAGAYICGEETSMLNSIEGHRGYPRVKPPFPAQHGLWGCPTTVNNVETISNIPKIVEMGGDWYSNIGAPKHPGPLLYGISGHVNNPGVYELPSGMLLTDLIYHVAGGVPGDKKIKLVIPGGTSMPPIRGEQLEGVRMDADSLKEVGSAVGTAGIIVMDEDTDIVRALQRITHFYWAESCGQCTPCREGTGWMLKLLNRMNQGDAVSADLDLLHSVACNIEGNTVCALGEAAAWPVRYTIERFRPELEEGIRNKASHVAA